MSIPLDSATLTVAATAKAVVRRRAKARDTADREWREGIRAAVEAGHSLRTVAEWAGISHVRVLQISRGE